MHVVWLLLFGCVCCASCPFVCAYDCADACCVVCVVRVFVCLCASGIKVDVCCRILHMFPCFTIVNKLVIEFKHCVFYKLLLP